jgi:hypothetical protein
VHQLLYVFEFVHLIARLFVCWRFGWKFISFDKMDKQTEQQQRKDVVAKQLFKSKKKNKNRNKKKNLFFYYLYVMI